MNRSWQQAKLIADAVKGGQVDTTGKSLLAEATRAGYEPTPDGAAAYAAQVLRNPAAYDYGVVERATRMQKLSPT